MNKNLMGKEIMGMYNYMYIWRKNIKVGIIDYWQMSIKRKRVWYWYYTLFNL